MSLSQGKSANKPKKSQAVSNTESRRAAYELLFQLIKKSNRTMQKFLDQQLEPFVKSVKKPDGWNYQPANDEAKSQAYVGLVNLGCICYMNSMMQQFFMTPAFRYNLMCVNDGTPPDWQDFRGETIDDNMLHQMQNICKCFVDLHTNLQC